MISMEGEKRYDLIDGDALNKIYDELRSRLNNIVPLVVVCGPGKCDPDEDCTACEPEKRMDCMYHQRNALKTALNDSGCLATTFEEDLELEYASLQEQIILREPEVDIVFIFPDSRGSAAELLQFTRDPVIRPKVRVLVPHQYHPLYMESESYLTSVYQELMATHGHVYPYDPRNEAHRTPEYIALMMMGAYRLYRLAHLPEMSADQ